MEALYGCTIRDKYGAVVSSGLVRTPKEAAQWFAFHGITSYSMEIKAEGNVIAEYEATL